ncbi:PBSX family phage terminase large subunit [Streptomyces olivaceus]|uniref:PBSX family phage terminase large subunit n=1 Tax=Streptomyces olivaceus TaxID=47716 RepID=UPI001CCCBAF8|nr:PBSX family phage terminase large subunit [Streptomyces olivaceus]MBZ6290410.1 PBSX family phage terminase large subunit [Streptomyces olivaceus]MBZ6324362.1 PBSX family phage terminase large subunit [Streptomyces olivaceus]
MSVADLGMSRKQMDFVANSTARINIASGSIRAGKTISTLLRWLIYVASAPLGGELAVIAKTTNTAASNVFIPLQDPNLFGPLAQHVHYTRGAPTATILGRPVRVIGANDSRAEERLRGMTCAGVLVDEATLVPQEFWTQLLGRMSVPGAKLFASTNPGSPAHWLKRDFIDRRDELGIRYWHYTLDDNPSLGEDYKNSIKAEFIGLWFRRFVLGEWIAAEGSIFDMWDEERHVVEALPEIAKWLSVGVDYGQANPFHATLLGLGRDRRLYVASEWRYDGRQQRRQLTDLEYSERMRGWLSDVPGVGAVRPSFVTVDPSAASFSAQLRRDRLTPTPAKNDVLDGIRTVASLLAAGKLCVHSSCKSLIAEMPSYAWDDKAAEKGEDKPIKIADHGIDSIRYAIFTTRPLWQQKLAIAA